MDTNQIHLRLEKKFGSAIVALEEVKADSYIEVSADKIFDICKFLHEDSELLFDSLVSLSGVHYLPMHKRATGVVVEAPIFEVVYHFFSYSYKHKLTVKTVLPVNSAKLQSVEKIWKGANWLERETYDMFGIEFIGNSDLRRILCPEDWEGWPLKKDYVTQEMYKHMRVPM